MQRGLLVEGRKPFDKDCNAYLIEIRTKITNKHTATSLDIKKEKFHRAIYKLYYVLLSSKPQNISMTMFFRAALIITHFSF